MKSSDNHPTILNNHPIFLFNHPIFLFNHPEKWEMIRI